MIADANKKVNTKKEKKTANDVIQEKGLLRMKNQLENDAVSAQTIEEFIHNIRGKKVILDSDLAQLYQVTTKRLNEQIKRNIDRFPDDFLFQLTQEEDESLKSQIATSKNQRGGRRYHINVTLL